MNIKELLSKEAIEEGEKFINDIKAHKIKKMTLPNVSEDFPEDKSLESFKNILKNKEINDIIDSIYILKRF
ncbi:MAG: hypothetical protein A2086_01005 [Spirochaetes bacterium GWD1_27_9]|nr:MAG: hypothetical protein A2Z98_15935 [Spirochaetes bacterium GWB1_27_13]OHD24202.1 MAG: hypothetical protein A2Y34_02475 [Spirochaetes bacterium GWC1_27_15]OHD33631.1 MAG: hypothetical protein A2086_01005 [Spirochaetes bacterium GWD1_27_9]